MKTIINKLYNNPKWQLLTSLVLAALCLGVSYLTHGIYWETSDDPGIINIISGKYNGTPSFSFPFLNAFLGYFFSSLYKLTPLVPWYSIFHLIIKFVSLVVIFRLTLLVLNKKGFRWFVPVISCVFVFLSVFLYPTLYMSFTTTSAISGCTAIALLFAAYMNSESKWRYAGYIFSGFFLVLSFMIRYNCGLVSTCFWVLMLAYITIKAFGQDKRSGIKRAAKSILAIVLVLVIGVVQNSISRTLRENYEPDGYLTYNSYRSKFVDFTTASWETSADFYEELGWDEDFYHLAKNWFFLDTRFNLESLKAINEETVKNSYGVWTAKEGIFSVAELILKDPIALSATVIIAALFLLIFVEFLLSESKKKSLLFFLIALCAVGGAGILCLYQCLQGRFLLRVYQTITFPTIVTLFIIAMDLLDKNSFAKRKKLSKTVVALLSVLAIFVVVISVNNIYRTRKQNVDKDIYSKQELVDYAEQHPDSLYVYAPFLNTSYKAFTTYNPETAGARNVMSWGGCGVYSRSYYEFLNLHGYDEFYSDNFYDENVYLVIDISDAKREDTVKSYLEHNYGPTEMVEVYRTNSFIIYDINYLNQ